MVRSLGWTGSQHREEEEEESSFIPTSCRAGKAGMEGDRGCEARAEAAYISASAATFSDNS